MMRVVRAQLDAQVAAGRTIKPAQVRDREASMQRGPGQYTASARSTLVRTGRDHKPPERHRSR